MTFQESEGNNGLRSLRKFKCVKVLYAYRMSSKFMELAKLAMAFA